MTRHCNQRDCENEVRAAGYCNGHYQRKRLGKDMATPLRVKYTNDRERFWAKVEKSGSCWIWTGHRNDEGYGKFSINGRPRRAHRISYEWEHGEIADAMEIDHVCHNRACIRPSHLRAVTSGQNGQNLQGAYRTSGSGVRGVSWFKLRGVWRAEAKLAGIRYFLGYFADLSEAAETVATWRREHMPYSEMDKKKEAA